MNNNYNKAKKETKVTQCDLDRMNKKCKCQSKSTNSYAFYSKVLEKVFDSLEELTNAEEAHFAELRAKEDKAATKKADAKKVEDAFVALNAERKVYKEDLLALTKQYSEDLIALKEGFEKARTAIKEHLATAEETYATALKTFTEKYPEGYHLTLKDGDFETTIQSKTSTNRDFVKDFNLFDLFFNL